MTVQTMFAHAIVTYDNIRTLRAMLVDLAADEGRKAKPDVRVLSSLATAEESLRKCHVTVRNHLIRVVEPEKHR